MISNEWDVAQEQDLAYLWHPWTPVSGLQHGLPLYVRGDGCYVFDAAGKKYLDARSAALNASLGYGRRDIIEVIAEQMMLLMTFELAGASTVPPIQLAVKIAELLPPPLRRTFFCSSGSEATEAAIKMSRMYHRLRGETERTTIIGFRGGYHGATWGALALSNSVFNQEGYEPLAGGFLAVDHPNGITGYTTPVEQAIGWVECAIREQPHGTVAAFIAEPVLGIGGIRLPPDGYFKLLREVCDRSGILLIFDEILTGFGRTGRMFAFEHWGVIPDILLTSKCLTGGYIPLSAITTSDAIYNTFARDPLLGGFRHGHTNSGHAAACAGALAVLTAIEREGLIQNAAELGKKLLEGLRSILATYPAVVEARGLGLLIGIEFAAETTARPPVAERFAKRALMRGLLVRQQENIVTLAPPLVLSEDECSQLLDIIWNVLNDISIEDSSGRI